MKIVPPKSLPESGEKSRRISLPGAVLLSIDTLLLLLCGFPDALLPAGYVQSVLENYNFLLMTFGLFILLTLLYFKNDLLESFSLNVLFGDGSKNRKP